MCARDRTPGGGAAEDKVKYLDMNLGAVRRSGQPDLEQMWSAERAILHRLISASPQMRPAWLALFIGTRRVHARDRRQARGEVR